MQRRLKAIPVFLLLTILAAALSAAGAAGAAEKVRLVIDYGDGVQKHFNELPWRDGLTVLSATQLAEKHSHGIGVRVRSSGSTAFLLQIDDVANEGGGGKNWVFRVNGKLGDRSCGIAKVEAGDTILWRFQKYE